MKSFKLLKKYYKDYQYSNKDVGFIDNFLCYTNYSNENEILWLRNNYDNLKFKQVSFSNYNYKHLLEYYMRSKDIKIRDLEFDYREKDSIVEDICNELLNCVLRTNDFKEMKSLLYELNAYDISIEKITLTFKRNKYYLYNSGIITSINDDEFIQDASVLFNDEVLS